VEVALCVSVAVTVVVSRAVLVDDDVTVVAGSKVVLISSMVAVVVAVVVMVVHGSNPAFTENVVPSIRLNNNARGINIKDIFFPILTAPLKTTYL
jgi:hypothetical protein